MYEMPYGVNALDIKIVTSSLVVSNNVRSLLQCVKCECISQFIQNVAKGTEEGLKEDYNKHLIEYDIVVYLKLIL